MTGMVRERPIVVQPEIKPLKMVSLKRLCFNFGLKRYGQTFMAKFVELSSRKLQAPQDLLDEAERIKKELCGEIDTILKRRYPSQLIHEPPAQPINALVHEIAQKQRMELLAVVNARYFACLGWPAITLLAGAGYFKGVKILLDAGANPNAKNFLLRTPLMCAAKSGRLEIVELLLERDIDLVCQDACKYDAMRHARESGHELIATMIKQRIENSNALEIEL